ncbi:MAG: hypothetical protein NC421_07395 [Lachnospiraceae bacterium]|nr:hypothetical protein [Lachnospiraceae bacterium]
MTIEERDTARAIQIIARELKKPAQLAPIDWEQRKWEAAKAIYAANFGSMNADEAVFRANELIEEYKSQTNKPE